MQPVGFYRCWYMYMMCFWCSSMSMYICRRAWRSPFNIIWCGGSISLCSMMWWIHIFVFNDVVDLYSTSIDVLDLWCQSMTSEVPLGAKNSFLAYYDVLWVSTVHTWCLALGQACLKCNNGYTSYSELLGSCHSPPRMKNQRGRGRKPWRGKTTSVREWHFVCR